MVGFEPTLSCARGTRITKLSYTLNKSTQRGSNPRLRHGKAARSHYAMGTCSITDTFLSVEHRVGFEPTFPQYECGVLAAGRPVHLSSGTGRTRTVTNPVKSRVCCH